MNKQKLKSRQQAAKKRKIRKKETEDSEGIRRKGDKKELDPLIFYIIKLVLIVFITISYFKFSTLLLPLFIIYTSLFFVSFMVERKINRSYNNENKKKVFRADSSLAFITLVVSISSAIFSFSTMVGNKMNSFSMYFYRIMSLSTGVRNKNGSSFGFSQGMQKPSGNSGSRPSGGSGERPPRPDFDLSDLPVEVAFNQILSSIIQVLIFSVLIIGLISVILFFYKRYYNKKIKIKQNEKNDWSFSKEDLIKLLEEKI